jgi:hypothetical protein
MKTILTRLFSGAILCASLIAPVCLLTTTLRADDRVYHDRDHRDEHHWDAREDQAYRMWFRERHRRYEDFDRIREHDRRAYWNWRHRHSDEVLHINIR